MNQSLKNSPKWDRVRSIMAKNDLDALGVKSTENVLYFTNWWPITGWGVAVIFRDHAPVVFVPDSEMEWTRFSIVQDLRPYAPDGNESVYKVLEQIWFTGLRIGIEKSVQNLATSHLCYEIEFPSKSFFDGLRARFPRATFIDATPAIYEMRRVKTAFEIEQLRLVQKMNAYGIAAPSDACKAGA